MIHTYIAPMLQKPEHGKSAVLNMCLVIGYLICTSNHVFILYYSVGLVLQSSVTTADSHITRSSLLALFFYSACGISVTVQSGGMEQPVFTVIFVRLS